MGRGGPGGAIWGGGGGSRTQTEETALPWRRDDGSHGSHGLQRWAPNPETPARPWVVPEQGLISAWDPLVSTSCSLTLAVGAQKGEGGGVLTSGVGSGVARRPVTRGRWRGEAALPGRSVLCQRVPTPGPSWWCGISQECCPVLAEMQWARQQDQRVPVWLMA